MKRCIKKLITVLSFLILYQVNSNAQEKIDSLLQALKMSSEKEMPDIHLQLCYAYTDNKKVLYHAKQANIIAKRLGDSLNIVKSGRLVGWSYRKLNHLDSSINACKQVLSIAKRNNYMFEYGKLLNGLGVTYTFVAKYDEALKCHFESLAAMESIDNKKWMSVSLSNIGLVYYKMLDTGRALDYNLRALKLKRSINYLEAIDILLINIALCHSSLHNFPEAMKYVNFALETCGAACTSDVKIQAEFARGMIAFRLKKADEAEQYFLRSSRLAKDAGDERFHFDNAAMLARIYITRGELVKAEQILREAETLTHSIDYKLEVIELYKQLYTLYRDIGDNDKLVFYQRKYIYLKDSIYSKDLTNNLMRIQSEYLERENTARLSSQQQALELKDRVIVTQNWIGILCGVVAVLLICIVYILYKVSCQRKQANQLLQKRVAERMKEQEGSHKHLQAISGKRRLMSDKFINNMDKSVLLIKDISALAIIGENEFECYAQIQEINRMTNTLSDTMKVYKVHQMSSLVKEEK